MIHYENIMQAALSMLSHKKMTIQETTRRLIKKFPNDQPSILQAVQRLQEMGYLNDYSYVQAYARDRMKFRPRGISMIKMELRKKGLSKNVVDEAISKIYHGNSPDHDNFQSHDNSPDIESTFGILDEFSAAQRIVTTYMKKSSLHSRSQNEIKRRLKNFLLSKGFSFQIINSVIKKLTVLK